MLSKFFNENFKKLNPSGFNRKYAIRILAIKHHEGKKQSGRTKTYSERSIRHLKRLWVIMGEMCFKKMVQALKTWLKYYEDDDCDEEIREELLSMGHASIDRYLKSYKASLGRKKRTGTRPGKMFKNVIPLKSFVQNIDRPEYIEADTVAHCGDSLSGEFAWSLTFTDVYSGWTENRATYGKDSDEVLSAIMDIQFKLPFPVLSFNTVESSHLTMGQKEVLRRRYELLNPIELREIIKRQILKLNRYKQEIEDLKLAA